MLASGIILAIRKVAGVLVVSIGVLFLSMRQPRRSIKGALANISIDL